MSLVARPIAAQRLVGSSGVDAPGVVGRDEGFEPGFDPGFDPGLDPPALVAAAAAAASAQREPSAGIVGGSKRSRAMRLLAEAAPGE